MIKYFYESNNYVYHFFLLILFAIYSLVGENNNQLSQNKQQVQTDQKLINNCVKADRYVSQVSDGVNTWIVCEPKGTK
jgi:hypothetical protein